MGKKGFNRDAVDLVERAIGTIIEKQKEVIQPGSEGGLRRGKATAKKLPAKRRKRSAFL